MSNNIIKYFLSELGKRVSGKIIPLVDRSNKNKLAFVHKWNHSNYVDFSKIHNKKDFDTVLAIIEQQLMKPVRMT